MGARMSGEDEDIELIQAAGFVPRAGLDMAFVRRVFVPVPGTTCTEVAQYQYLRGYKGGEEWAASAATNAGCWSPSVRRFPSAAAALAFCEVENWGRQ